MSNNIEGKVVVITGASSGLGEATARLLSAQGASVVLGARRHDRIQALAGELTGRGGKAIAITTDVTQCEQVKRLVDAAVQACGRIDVMINNAGLMPQAPLDLVVLASAAAIRAFPPKACPGPDPGWAPVRRRKCDERIESRAHPRSVLSEIDSIPSGCALVSASAKGRQRRRTGKSVGDRA